MDDVFSLDTFSNYDIRSRQTVYDRSLKSIYKETETLADLASKIWELIPENIKSIDSLLTFK